ncbi:hypothetical protein FRD01_04000 [Microvenator marinus]|uniref:Uncharacterized protein n=1 Tax=Microvenator marinus TaxID=2600177 RepID=A0A5B8XQW6_9DELT|nr:hypothetical protein [Microvenator marinus]QED26423.1 hypothetical protein FRD01_04000 [Microvenator marinus]
MSHDPLEYIDSYNMYAFAALDPINFWDPWGLDAQELAEDIDGLKETGAKIWNSAKSMAQSVKSSVENFFRSSGTEDSETGSSGNDETLDPLDSYKRSSSLSRCNWKISSKF